MLNLDDPLAPFLARLPRLLITLLAEADEPLNGRQLTSRIGEDRQPSTVKSALNTLVDLGLVRRTTQGNAHLHCLNRGSLLWPAIESVIAARDTLIERLRSAIDDAPITVVQSPVGFHVVTIENDPVTADTVAEELKRALGDVPIEITLGDQLRSETGELTEKYKWSSTWAPSLSALEPLIGPSIDRLATLDR